MQILKELSKYKKQMIFACLFIGLASFLDLMLPTIMSNMIDEGINKSDMNYIYTRGLLMLGITVISVSSYLIAAKNGSIVCCGFFGDLVNKTFRKVDEMDFDQFSELGPSALLTRTVEDAQLLSEAVYFVIRMVIALPVTLVGGVVLAFTKNATLSLIMFLFLPIFVTMVVLIGRKMMKCWEVSDKYFDKQTEILRERLSGIRVIRAFNKEDHEHERIVDATNVMADNVIKANVTGGFIGPVALLLFNVATVLILLIGGKSVQPGGTFSAIDVIAIIQYITIIMNSLMMFSWMVLFFPRVKVKMNRISEVLNVKTEKDDSTGSLKLKGDVEFKGVSFRYEGASEYAVKNLDMKIKSGQTVAIIGGTGCGKSTVVQLLMGFYKPTEGTILFDGKDASSLSRKDIRDNVSCALQKSTIFSATVKENVLMGKDSATDEEVENVTDIAEIREYIKTLEGGYGYELEQGGSNLSGGQKQRIAIARAIVKPSEIYIFDDTFSALDFLTESKLRKKLNEFIRGKTQIVITQRISTAMNADRIFVLDKGEIVGTGKHEDLIRDCTIYREIYRSQVGGDLDE